MKRKAIKDRANMLPTSQCEKQPNISDAYWQGFHDCKAGLEDNENPFPVKTVQHNDWNAGWVDFYFDCERGQ